MKPPRVCICTPVYDTMEVLFERSMRALDMPSMTAREETWGVTIDEARRVLVEKALEKCWVTHVLFVDADMVFPTNALTQLLKYDLPIVGGLYFNRRPPYAPMLLRSNHPSRHVMQGLLGHVYGYPSGKLVEVDATGCGFMLIAREVFEKINETEPNNWFDRGMGLPEDFSFCCRALQAGFKIFVDTGLNIGHVGKVVIDADFARINGHVPMIGDPQQPWNPLPL